MSTPPIITPQEFVDKWRSATLKERSAYQEHFIDLCRLIGHPTPAEVDPTGENFAFEYGAAKTTGGNGFADVFKRRFFGWEYKGKHADLDKAYQQLLNYREDLHNPPLLVVCDIDRLIIHTNFTNTRKRTRTLLLDDLLTQAGRQALKAVFEQPAFFEQIELPAQVTQQAADRFATLAEHLRTTLPDTSSQTIAHFLIRCLFCLFAEDVDLLHNNVFTKLVEQGRVKSDRFTAQLRQLFAAMATGGYFGVEDIRHFDGGLFNDDAAAGSPTATLPIDRQAIEILAGVVQLDWSNIEPSIFGELFVRGLDPGQRAKLGAQYTDRADIELIVEAVLMAPLRRRWAEVERQARDLTAQRDEAKGTKRAKLEKQLSDLLRDFALELATIRVLDAACGSGNFLYVALVMLLDLWREVAEVFAELTLQRLSPLEAPSPTQLRGIEINEYARELAQATIWIGYIQWFVKNGYGFPAEPILKPIDSIEHRDAILNPDGTEPDWPECEVIVGNPPFLGDKKMRTEMGDEYVGALRKLYAERIPGQSDLVCYWFEKARAMIEQGKAKRAGLLATQAIRHGLNRTVLDRIKQSGDIFWAWSDREWILDGAAVRVSMIGFDHGVESMRTLDGNQVNEITPELSHKLDLSRAAGLAENSGVSFVGPSPHGSFDIEDELAQTMLNAPLNPNGRPNSDVVRHVVGAAELVHGTLNRWTIDFGLMSHQEAASYILPFEHLKRVVYPVRAKNRRAAYAERWWQYAEARSGMRAALWGKARYVATPRVSKHRFFVWIAVEVLSNDRTFVFARDDDYFFGILQSRIHEIWSLATSSRHGVAGDIVYNNTTCFETFPFPWPLGHEPSDDPRVQAIAQAAQALNKLRGDLKLTDPRYDTLTKMYNEKPEALMITHRKLDAAVFAAYGWPSDLSDDEILARLLALNLGRTSGG